MELTQRSSRPVEERAARCQRLRRHFTEQVIVIPREAATMIKTDTKGYILHRSGRAVFIQKAFARLTEPQAAEPLARRDAMHVDERLMKAGPTDVGGRAEVRNAGPGQPDPMCTGHCQVDEALGPE